MGFQMKDPLGNPDNVGSLLGIFQNSLNTDAMSKAYKTQAGAADTNAALAKIDAQEAVRRGKESADLYGQAFKQAYGKQYSSIVGQGVDPTMGSALSSLMDFETGGALDIAHIRNNAASEAYGFEKQADQYSLEAEQERAKSKAVGGQGLLTGGLQWLKFVKDNQIPTGNKKTPGVY